MFNRTPSPTAGLAKASTASRTAAWHDVLGLVTAGAMLMLWDQSGLDVVLAHRLGDTRGFVWRHEWITAGLLHDGARSLAGLALALLAWGVWRPWWAGVALTRQQRIVWLVSTALCLVAVGMLRHASTTSCPWSLSEFGGAGVVPYVPHWQLGVHDGGPGGCFPSAHASAGFAFISGWFALRRAAPGAGRIWLAMAILTGSVLTGVQVLRGAHFLSHGLWAGWVCWASAAAVHHLAAGLQLHRKARRRTAAS